MAPLTPDQSRDAFRHILRNVLGCDTTTSLYKALLDNGYDLNIASLQGISEEEIQEFSYPTSQTNDKRRAILTSERAILRIWKAYLTWKHAKGEPITSGQLSAVDPDKYDTFRFGPYLQTTYTGKALVHKHQTSSDAQQVIKTQAAQLKTQTGPYITYENYSDLLKSAALQHDKITAPGTGRSASRNAYQSLTHPSAGEDFASTRMDKGYDIDLPVATILANAASTLPPDPGEDTLIMAHAAAHVPDHLWNKLSPNGKCAWVKVPPDERDIDILLRNVESNVTSPSNGTSTGPHHSPSGRSTRSANLHEISAFDFIVMQHQFQFELDPGPATNITSGEQWIVAQPIHSDGHTDPGGLLCGPTC